MDFAGSETPTTDPSAIVEETLTYVVGTELVASRTLAGETTESHHDHLNRVVETRVKPNTATTLASKRTYVGTRLFASEDPYGRKSFHAYDATDGRLIRSVQTTVSSVTFADQTAVLAAVRPAAGSANPSVLITDYL